MLRAAFYEKDITPPLGGYMWGNYRAFYASEVYDKLYVKALVIDDGNEAVAIACFDSCVVPSDIHDFVAKRVAEYVPVKAENICLCSNHTHKGIPVTDSPELNIFADSAYRDVFYRLVADSIILAYNRLDESEAFFGVGNVKGVSFNRNFLLSDGQKVTHNRGRTNIVKTLAGIDEDLTVMFYKNKAGEPIGAIISFALHQDCTGGANVYSGDYSSILAKELKKIYGPDFVSLFVLGTCGDINHIPHDGKPIPEFRYREIGKILADEAVRTIEKAEPAGEGGIKAEKKLLKIKRRIYDKEYYNKKIESMLSDKGFMRIRNLIAYEAMNDKDYSELYVQVIKIGDVIFFAMPGEVYVDHGLYIKGKSPFQKTFVVSDCNSYCGYIPTKECFEEGDNLYETTICKHSCHVPEAGEIIREELLSMADNIN